ncbi:MAG: DNA topoisomerase IB [Rhodospirillaceae bacterium]
MAEVEDEDIVRAAGLAYTTIESLVIVRRRCGRGFAFVDGDGAFVRDRELLARLRSIAIPPAYTDVRIAPHPNQHLQAVGRDEAGRLQYLYHPDWETVREARKGNRLDTLSRILPKLRRRLAYALRQKGTGRELTLAAAVTLIDRTHIRVGYEDYLHSGRSRGAATLLKSNVECDGDRVRLAFHGKRRKPVRCSIYAPALSRVLKRLMKLPGRRMFQYRDDTGRRRQVSAAEINRYLHDVSGIEITAKDFRSLAATAAAAERLAVVPPAGQARQRQRQVAEAMKEVAGMLGNTPAVVRRSYVHRRVVEAFEAGDLARLSRSVPRQRNISSGESLVRMLFV